MTLSFEEIRINPDVLAPFKWTDSVEVCCSYCKRQHLRRKESILRALRLGQHGVYCKRPCGRSHMHERAVSHQEGEAGRVCKICGRWKPLVQMGNAGKAKTCHQCWSKRPLQKFNEYARKSERRGWRFCLSREEFMSFWGKDCHYCGDAIETIGLDRVDNTQDYVLRNVVPCCTWCNYAKHTSSQEEFLRRCRAIAARHSP